MGQPVVRHSGIIDVRFGNGVIVVQPINIYGATIGDDVFIGPFVEIQRGVSIGRRSRVQSHSFICELVTIGEDCVIAHGVVFINDRFSIGGPAKGNRKLWEPTIIGDRVSIGSNATILPVEICSDVVIGAGSVVTKNITAPGIYGGNPTKLLRQAASKNE